MPSTRGGVLKHPGNCGTAAHHIRGGPVAGGRAREGQGCWTHLVEGGEVMDLRPSVTWFIL